MGKKKKNQAKETAAKRGKQGQRAEKQSASFLSLTVENIRCFGRGTQTLDLSDGDGRPAHWTVLLGDNGTGKTTLLMSLALFYDWGVLAEAPTILHKSLRGFSAESLRVVLGSLVSVDASMGKFTAHTAGGGRVADSGVPSSVDNWALEFGPAGLPEKIAFTSPSKNAGLPTSYCYGAARRMGTTALSQRESDNPIANLFDDRVDLRNAEEWLLQLDYAATKSSPIQQKQRATLELVRELLISILPDVEDIRFSNPTKAKPRPGVEFKTPDGWIPLQWIGYGYRTAMAWMVDLASRMVERYPDSKDPLTEPAVVLVDEIDLHLHPSWQRKLMSYLSERFPNVQFIVTAHSPLFVQAAEGANLVVLERRKDHVVIRNDVEAVKGWRIDQVVTSDLFGVKSARPPVQAKLLEERKKLLTKAKLTATDKKKLAALEKKIGPLPAGEKDDDRDTMALLDKTLKTLEKKRSGRR